MCIISTSLLRQSISKHPEVKEYQMRLRREELGGGWKGKEGVSQEGPRSLVPLPLSTRTHSGYPCASQRLEKKCLWSQWTLKNVCNPDVAGFCSRLHANSQAMSCHAPTWSY